MGVSENTGTHRIVFLLQGTIWGSISGVPDCRNPPYGLKGLGFWLGFCFGVPGSRNSPYGLNGFLLDL